MTALAALLRGALDACLEAGDFAGMAVVTTPEAGPRTAWSPADADEEPGFLAYSVTKTFTAVLLLRLEEAGCLDLDAPLARFRDDVPGAERVSIRRLLDHTAGIPDYGGLAAYHEAVRAEPSRAWSAERFAAETFAGGLLFEPGEGWAYSNPGYMLLRSVAETAGGAPWAQLLAERVTGPLGLVRTFAADSVADLRALAPAPSTLLSPDRAPRDTRNVYDPRWVSHGVLASTASELARFLAALFGGALLTRRSLERMTRSVPVPGAFPPWVRPSYGLGLMIDTASPWGRMWGHDGGGPGYGASAFHLPDLGPRGVTLAVMCNREEGRCADSLLRAALERIREVVRP